MRFLLDVCVSSRSLEDFLIGKGHDVLSVVAIDPKASDEQILAVAVLRREADVRVRVLANKRAMW